MKSKELPLLSLATAAAAENVIPDSLVAVASGTVDCKSKNLVTAYLHHRFQNYMKDKFARKDMKPSSSRTRVHVTSPPLIANYSLLLLLKDLYSFQLDYLHPPTQIHGTLTVQHSFQYHSTQDNYM